jgi:hypothetical protein
VNKTRFGALLATFGLALLAAGPAQSARFGLADDAGKYAEDGGHAFLTDAKALGASEVRVTILWDPLRPDTILEQSFLDRSLPVAKERGVNVVFHVFPIQATAITAVPDAADGFATFLEQLATTYPQVRQYIVGNEPNQPRFWRPQYTLGGKARAASTYLELLAKSYDALKSVDPRIKVIGLGLSGRGNDSPFARSNASTSPVRFLRDLGAAYRASGRALPIMDELGVHPYPRTDRDSVLVGDRWPRAGVVNLARIKQAVWDAFAGTGQPTVEKGLRLRIDEIGWQVAVPAARRSAYHGRETSSVTTEKAQAANYEKLIRLAACDASVSAVYLLHLRDDANLERFQSGLRRADGSARPSYTAVRKAVAAAKRGCAGKRVAWHHATGVIGRRADFRTGAGAQSRLRKSWSFALTAAEEATYTGAVFPAASASASVRSLAKTGTPGAVLVASGTVRAGWKPLVRFPVGYLKPGRYVYAVRLRAAMNGHRTSVLVSRSFTVR